MTIDAEESKKVRVKPVLLVEDDLDIQELVSFAVNSFGAKCVIASDGKMVFESVLGMTPSLIIMDIGLPGQDGFSIVEKLKAVKRLENIPIIIITAHTFADSISLVDKAKTLGCDQFIQKPIELGEFKRIISEYLSVKDE